MFFLSWSMIQGSKAIFLWDISSSDWGISVKNFMKFCFETYSFIAFLSNYVPAHQINFVKVDSIMNLVSDFWCQCFFLSKDSPNFWDKFQNGINLCKINLVGWNIILQMFAAKVSSLKKSCLELPYSASAKRKLSLVLPEFLEDFNFAKSCWIK